MGYIVIGSDETCSCHCGMKCIVDKRCGSSPRCTKQEIENAGFKTLMVENAFYLDDRDILLAKRHIPAVPPKKKWHQELFKF